MTPRTTWARAVTRYGFARAHALDTRGDTLCGSILRGELDYPEHPEHGYVCDRCERILAGMDS